MSDLPAALAGAVLVAMVGFVVLLMASPSRHDPGGDGPVPAPTPTVSVSVSTSAGASP